MNFSETKFFKPALWLLCLSLLAGVSQFQRVLYRDRKALGLMQTIDDRGMPPVLAFTTVAFGGFRGLIANALWMRMNDLQDEDKYFEMVQLADWITKLEPHFVHVWLVQGWNMAYNVSVKFNDPMDRWRWVQRGIELLRDDGLRYNPDETLIYREISWFFQHKMGHNLDDAHMIYKREWFHEMDKVIGKKPDYNQLLNPTTEEAKKTVRLLREKYKMDPQVMKEVDEKYGPMEWRLPDAHAVYWAELGRRKGKQEDQDRLVRSIYQTMQQSFRRGAIYPNLDGTITLGPNLDAIPNVNKSYEEPMKSDDAELREQPVVGHRNFLKDVVYFLYMQNRKKEAAYWYKYLQQKYPTAMADYVRSLNPMADTNNIPTLEEFAISRVSEDVGETDVDRITALVEGLLRNSYFELIQDEDDRAANYSALARQVHNRFSESIKGAEKRVKLPPMETLRQRVLNLLLDAERGLPPEAADRLRTKLGLEKGAASTINSAVQ
jgi:hypothetical protein